MFTWELEKLLKNIGQLVSANAFFSASRNENVAEMFADYELDNPHQKSVLLQIKIDTQLQHTIVAPIAHLSGIPLENEVLFNLLTVFRIVNVCEESSKNLWCIYLQTTDEGREVVDRYKYILSTDDEYPTIEIVFGRLLIHIDQFGRAYNYFTSLVNRFNDTCISDVILYAVIICGQADCLYHMGKYEEAQECSKNGLAILDKLDMSPTSLLYLRCRYHLANALLLTNAMRDVRSILEDILCEQQKQLPEDHIQLADTYRAIGYLIGNEIGYDKALKYRQEALRIYEKTLPKHDLRCIRALISLAGSYEAIGQFRLALDLLNRALHLQENYLPNEHSSRAVTFRSIGIIHEILSEPHLAFDYYCRAYSIWMFQYPQGHTAAVFCFNRIGRMYSTRKQFSEALQCQLEALEMRKSLFKKSIPHPQDCLGRTYLDIGDNVKAIEILHSACDFWKAKSNDPSNKYLNAIESLLATAYSHNGEFHRAQELFERVLSLQETAHSDGNPDIGYTLHHMASNLVRMNGYTRAIQCDKESRRILLKLFSENHCELVTIREKMVNFT